MKKTVLFLVASSFSPLLFAKLIYNYADVKQFENPQNYPLSIQLGSFKDEKGAYQLIREVQSQHFQKIAIKPEQGQYKVIVGPFDNKNQALDFYQHYASKTKQIDQVSPVVAQETIEQSEPQIHETFAAKTPAIQDNYFKQSRWYVNADVGGQYPHLSGSTTVNNGSGLSAPNNQDIYSINNSSGSVLLDVGVGKSFQVQNNILSALAIGFEYQYFFANDINGQITQFSLPEFQNYNYTYPVASNLVLGTLKLNLNPVYRMSPFFKLGLGGSILNQDGYKETALSNVTPRISPNYATGSSTNFAYTLGVGVEYALGQQFSLSAAYQFSDLGSMSSGHGEGSWSSQSLNLGRYQSNAFLLGGSYFFDLNLA